ncbi:MAG: hypothetical protein ABIA74_01595 [bacterium]
MNIKTLIPTQLFVGSEGKTEESAENYIQSFFCKNSYEWQADQIKTCFCNQCQKIKKRQHESLIWIDPEKDYVIDDIEIIFEKIKFSLDENQNFFFVLQNAENLTPATANRLLKVLEEPPTGFNFILLTKNENNILPTIKSRCLISNFSHIEQENIETDPILSFFIDEKKLSDHFSFDSELKKQKLTDSQATELINTLLNHFSKKIINIYKEQQGHNELETYKEIESFLKNKLRKPPQSGSANLFLKNIFLSFPKA